MVPNCNRNVTSGWSNYSCKVTSQNTSEKNVGYRGSKSVISNITVKEQRVDGSWDKNINIFVFKVYSNGFRKKLSGQKPF